MLVLYLLQKIRWIRICCWTVFFISHEWATRVTHPSVWPPLANWRVKMDFMVKSKTFSCSLNSIILALNGKISSVILCLLFYFDLGIGRVRQAIRIMVSHSCGFEDVFKLFVGWRRRRSIYFLYSLPCAIEIFQEDYWSSLSLHANVTEIKLMKITKYYSKLLLDIKITKTQQ